MYKSFVTHSVSIVFDTVPNLYSHIKKEKQSQKVFTAHVTGYPLSSSCIMLKCIYLKHRLLAYKSHQISSRMLMFKPIKGIQELLMSMN